MKIEPPSRCEPIKINSDGSLSVPDHPIIPCIPGDGIGVDIWPATRSVLDAAVKKVYGGGRFLGWMEVPAGGTSLRQMGDLLPEATLEAIRQFRVAIKGPMTTPVGGGFRSINVTLRQKLELYACVRPVRYLPGMPSPMRQPEKVDMIVFRENMEDVYAGIEWQRGTPEAHRFIDFLDKEMGVKVPDDSGVGVKPISETATRRLVRMAIRYAIRTRRNSVTLVHIGNIMKFTEGAFRDWGYLEARENFHDQTVTEEELFTKFNGQCPADSIIIKDRIADSMFQQVLLRPEEYSVLALPNLNGDYLSDALAAQVGGLGMAPGGNIGDDNAVFEATHGTAPKYAGKDVSNPGSLILSGVMMLEHLGWQEAADAVVHALITTIGQKRVTYDLARQLPGSTELKCSDFARAITENL
ncbi:MAG: isocitrate dehydrogenase (NADP(+)) [Deltaproteobacteria bacterium]|nr:isocitrate dehydrogenase (NADP(+)) [Deltaproteobacteria bacterium]